MVLNFSVLSFLDASSRNKKGEKKLIYDETDIIEPVLQHMSYRNVWGFSLKDRKSDNAYLLSGTTTSSANLSLKAPKLWRFS